MAEALAALGGAVTVLELSKVACSLAQTLYTFCRNTKHVNENLRELAAEVNSLGNTCSVVYNVLASLENEYGAASRDHDAQYSSLWSCVEEQVRECRRTVDMLAKSIEGMQKERSNFLAQASRSIRLTLKKDNITDIRSRIKLHMSCLQVTLQSPNIVVSNLAPKRADHELLDKIAALSRDVKDLKKQQEQEPGQAEVSVRRSSTAALRLSEEVITSGRKLYRESIRGGTITRTSTSATLVGPSEPDEKDDTKFGVEQKEDKDDEFAFEIADATAKEARTAFEGQDWASTIAYVEELMHGLKRGSFRLRSTPAVGSFDLMYMHAISNFHLEEPTDAKAHLLEAADSAANTDDERSKLFEVKHCLAITYVRLTDLEAAYNTCREVIEGRRRISAPRMSMRQESYADILALMSRICELQGNLFRAQIYLTMIPESRVDFLKAQYQSLHCPGIDDEKRASMPVVPLVSNDVAGLGISTLAINDRSDVSELNGPCVAGATESIDRKVDPPQLERPPLPTSNTESILSSIDPASSYDRLSPPLPSPPATAIPHFDPRPGFISHRRNESAPLGSRTVPGSPLLPSPRLNESAFSTRPVGTTGLFRGVSSRTRRSWLAGLNLRPSGDAEKAVCTGDLMALHSALNKESHWRRPSANIGQTDGNGNRALHFAALFGDVRIAHVLIMAGYDVHGTIPRVAIPGKLLLSFKPIDDCETALHLAIGARQAPMVEYLLSQGASLYYARLVRPTANLLDLDWLRATQCNSAQEILDVLKVLIDAGWDINQPLGLRSSSGTCVVQTLVSNPNWPFQIRPILSFCVDCGFHMEKSTLDAMTFREKVLELNDEEINDFLISLRFENFQVEGNRI